MRDIFGWTTSRLLQIQSFALDSQRVFYRSPAIKDWTNVYAQILLIQRRPSIRSYSVLFIYKSSSESNSVYWLELVVVLITSSSGLWRRYKDPFYDIVQLNSCSRYAWENYPFKLAPGIMPAGNANKHRVFCLTIYTGKKILNYFQPFRKLPLSRSMPANLKIKTSKSNSNFKLAINDSIIVCKTISTC